MMQRKAATASDWKTTPMPEVHAEFTFHRRFTQEQMDLLRYGNIPQAMEDKWFWYYEDDKLYIHRSWTGFCIFVVSFTPGSDELHALVNRDPEQYRSTDVNQDEYELNRLLTWWTQSDYDPDNQFLADTYRALLPLMQKDQKPTVEEKKQGCLYGGAAGDALGYAIEFLSLDQIRAKYGPNGIQYYELKDGTARFSDDTQMLLFTLEGIYLWQDKLRKRHDGAKLKNCLFDAYRDWVYTQENDGLPKERHKPHTQLYLIPSMHRRMGPGFTCMRSLRSKRAGSIENPLNDSKGNGGVMRVAPIGFYFPRNVYSLEEVMQMGAESAALTYGHPLGYISAAMMAGLVNECVYGVSETLKDAVMLSLDATMKMFAHIPEVHELHTLVTAAMELAQDDCDAVAHIAMLGHSACAESTMAIAIYCALRYEDSFDQAIRTAVNFNGDSDTIAAVTGNILGAWKGIKCIDQKWIEPLHLEEYLKVLEFYS